MAWPSSSARTKNWGTEILTDADLEAQLDLLHSYFNDSLNATTGHDHSGGTAEGPKISAATGLTIASQAQGDILYASSSSAFARLAKGTAGQLLRINSGATAPEWANPVALQIVNVQSGTSNSISDTIPYDNTIPQNSEGEEVMSLAITPVIATSKLKIEVVVNIGGATADAELIAALFQDSTAGALASGGTVNSNTSGMEQIKFTHYMTSGTTSETTFKVNTGANSGGSTFNGGDGQAKLGATLASSITITEYYA